MRSSIHPISTYPKRSEGRKLSKMKEETSQSGIYMSLDLKDPLRKYPNLDRPL